MPAFEHDFEQDAPVADATPEATKALQPADISLKWVLFHLGRSGQNPRLVARRNPL